MLVKFSRQRHCCTESDAMRAVLMNIYDTSIIKNVIGRNP